MKRNLLNFIVDLGSLVDLLGLVCTGYIIRYALPPGSGGFGRQLHDGQGREQIRILWSMSRHEWGTVHCYLAIMFVVLIVVHLILHWNLIKCCFKLLCDSSQKADLSE